MNNASILSVNHFIAYNQVVDDYRLLVFYEQELQSQQLQRKNSKHERTKKEIIFLLKRIILNKDILQEDSSADVDYLKKILTNYSNNV